MTTIRARYEHGVLRPLTPLTLAEGTEVDVSVFLVSSDAIHNDHMLYLSDRERSHAALLAAGLIRPLLHPVDALATVLTIEELEAIHQRTPAGRPLSEIIMEDREERY